MLQSSLEKAAQEAELEHEEKGHSFFIQTTSAIISHLADHY